LHNFSSVSGTESYHKQAAEAASVGGNAQIVQGHAYISPSGHHSWHNRNIYLYYVKEY